MAEPEKNPPPPPKGEDSELNIGRRVETPAPAAETKAPAAPIAPVATPSNAPAKTVESTGEGISSVSSLHFDAPVPSTLR